MVRTSIPFAALALTCGLAHAGEDAVPPVVHLEAYLDEAPANAPVTEEVRVTRDGEDRVLYVVTACPAISDDPGRVFRAEENQGIALRLGGAEADELMREEAGSLVEGTFVYHRATPSLDVADLAS